MTPILIALILLTISIYAFLRRKFSYWQRKNMPFLPPSLPFGNFREIGRKHPAYAFDKVYHALKGHAPVVGFYFFWEPAALIIDPEILRSVMVKDFDCFHDRGLFVDERNDPLSAHLFSLTGTRWRHLRSRLTPTFTSGKMKMMFETILEVAKDFQAYLDEIVQDGGDEFEFKDITARFTTQVIGSCAFGIETNSMRSDQSEFKVVAEKVFGTTYRAMLRLIFVNTFQAFSKLFGIRLTERYVEDFIMGLVKDTVDFRERNQVQRNDFMNLLLQLKNKGELDDGEKRGVPDERMTFNEIAAQCFVFFIAGYETSSTTMACCLYELSRHQDIQKRLRNEIDLVLADEEITYEKMMAIPYLDQVINETLRLYPPLTNVTREAGRPYTVPGTEITLSKGEFVIIPIWSIHHDPENYPEPEKFDPERFSAENVKKMKPFTFLSFGEGPRNCIGMRFGMMQTRIGLISLLTKFRVLPCDKTPKEIEISPFSSTLSPKDGIWLRLEALGRSM